MDERARIDEAVTGWATIVPELDVVTMRTALLLFRAVDLGHRRVEAAVADHGLSAGEFDVLASLLLAPDHTSKPSDLARDGMLSPAGMTHRLDLLEHDGHVERTPDPTDRRSTRITLTSDGRDLVIKAAQAHVVAEAELLAPLGEADQRQLDSLLGRLLDSLDGSEHPPVVAPAERRPS